MLTVQMIGVMKGVYEHKIYDDIAKDISQSRSQVLKLVNQLEKSGHLVRVPPTDPKRKRTNQRKLTDVGYNYLVENGLLKPAEHTLVA